MKIKKLLSQDIISSIMGDYSEIAFYLFIILIFVIIIYNYFTDPEGCGPIIPYFTENYIVYSYPKYCSACGELNRRQCNNCTNCGYCITPNGNGECVPGDSNGPYFREDCVAYEYNAPDYVIDRVYPDIYLYDNYFGYDYLDYPYHWKRDWYNYDLRGAPKDKNHKYKKPYPIQKHTESRYKSRMDTSPKYPIRVNRNINTRSNSKSGSGSSSRSGYSSRSISRPSHIQSSKRQFSVRHK